MNSAWINEGMGLRYDGQRYRLDVQIDRGWLGLRVGDADFLAAPSDEAAVQFRTADRWITTFSDAKIGLARPGLLRTAEVFDGIYLQRLTCREPDRVKVTAGFNDEADHDVVFWLHEEVGLVRVGEAEAPPASMRIVEPDAGSAVADGAVLLVHRSGAMVRLVGRLGVEVHRDGAGQRRWAVCWPCRGFEANDLELRMAQAGGPGAWLRRPRLNVEGGPPLPEGEAEPVDGAGMPAFESTEPITMNLTAGWAGEHPFEGTVRFRIDHFDGEVVDAAEHSVRAAADEATTVNWRPTLGRPGPCDVWVSVCDRDDTLLWAEHFRAVVDVEAYSVPDTRQSDHAAFWEATLAEMRDLPLGLRTERRFEVDGWRCVELSFDALAGRRIYAMLFVPQDASGPLPIVVGAHPNTLGWELGEEGGIHGSKINRDPRFAWFVPLIRGHRPDAKDVPFNHPWWGPMHDRETYEGRSWFSTMPRSLDVIASLDEPIDMKRVVAKGGSQGGALALVTAGLDKRVCLCLADCPSHCQLQNTTRRHPLTRSRLGQLPPGMSVAQAEAMFSYFDAANFAPMIGCPTLITHNIGDATVHIAGGLAAFKQLHGLPPDQKWLLLGAGTAHACPAPGQRKMRELMDAVAAGKLYR